MSNGFTHKNHVTDTRLVELSSVENDRYQRTTSKPRVAKQRMFAVGVKVLVAKGPTLSFIKKNTTLSYKVYGPCILVKADHPSHGLCSPNGPYIRRGIDARRLVKFYKCPLHLQWN